MNILLYMYNHAGSNNADDFSRRHFQMKKKNKLFDKLCHKESEVKIVTIDDQINSVNK